MTELPIWVWVVSGLGVIAAGIGLAYLIIFLFWKIENRFFPKPERRRDIFEEWNLEEKEEEISENNILEEVKVEETTEEPEEEPTPERENIEIAEEENKEEIAPVFIEPSYDESHRLIKFAITLRPRFNHSFQRANTIVCWDIGMENGTEVRDTEGNIMTLRIIEPRSEVESRRIFLVDESKQRAISVITVKEYLRREANLDIDKMKIQP